MTPALQLEQLSRQDIQRQLTAIAQRHFPEPRRRQVPFTLVETLLCYGLFSLLDPHRYGGRNIDSVPHIVTQLAAFFRRTPGSITNKMLNLDGSRQHSAREEPLLFASLASMPAMYFSLYREILTAARELAIGEDSIPDFLHLLSLDADAQQPEEELVGHDDLPASASILLAGTEDMMKAFDRAFALGDRLTEKLVERKIRLAQHRFALDVIHNCAGLCVFCGFEPRALPGLLRASHIKPWAVSDHRERVDVRNGLAACPTHDAAFDRGYLTVDESFVIHRAGVLQESLAHNQSVHRYFGEVVAHSLILPSHAVQLGASYLTYHREHIFKG